MGSIRQIKNYGKFIPFDPEFDNVLLLMHFDGDENGTTFIDNSGFAGTISRAGLGNPIVTTQTNFKFPTASGNSPSPATGRHLLLVSDANFGIGPDDFTFEWWSFVRSFQTSKVLFGNADSAANTGFYVLQNGSEFTLYTANDGLPKISTGTSSITLNRWDHWAFSKISGAWKAYRNGRFLVGSTTTINLVGPGSPLAIFGLADVGYPFGGPDLLLDDLRLTGGLGRYTGTDFTADWSNFPEITAPFPNV